MTMTVPVQQQDQPLHQAEGFPQPGPTSNRRSARHFFLGQRREIRDGGLRVLLRKVRTLVDTLLAVPAVLLMRALRPLVTIRVGPLSSSRIGPFSANVEVYLCERDAGLHGRRTVDLFYHALPVCNRQLKRMWDRTLPVSRFVASLNRVNGWFPGANTHRVPMPSGTDRDFHGLLATTRPHLSFTEEECRRGWASLAGWGIGQATPYVCFQAREPRYLAVTYPDRNWDYHNYRNADIQNLLPAVETLTRRGYMALRVGAVVEAPMETSNPRILDYARNGRTEFLDIFVGAHCRFYLGDPSGIACIPVIFRRRVAFVNFIPFAYVRSWSAQDLLIPKTLWLRSERRWLTFREILDSGIGRCHWAEQYERHGIEVIENTPEEITALAVEMDERLRGTWQTTPEDEELQRRFWSLFTPSTLRGVIRGRIGAEFLRQHRGLLE